MDLDGDGRTEILSGSWPGEIYLFRRKPNGTFAAPEMLRADGRPIRVGSASAVATADWDDDGDVDLVIGTIDGYVFVAINTGTAQKPVFATPVKLEADHKVIKVDSDAGPCLADWEADGKIDLILGSGSGKVEFYRNFGTKKKFELAAPVELVSAAGAHGANPGRNSTRSGMRSKPAVFDWNGDGRPDLLVGDFHSGDAARQYHGWVWVYLRRGNGLTAQAGK